MPTPLCEPVKLSAGSVARVERVWGSADSVATARLSHFHAPAEIVLFERASGWFFHDRGEAPLGPKMIIYVPAFAYHDFAIDGGVRGWQLVQFDAAAARAVGAPVPDAPIACTVGDERWQLLTALADWLGAPDETPAGASARLAALLWAIAPLPTLAGSQSRHHPIDRFRPVIERLSTRPERSLGLAEAAGLCTLSPTHFSRRFRAVFGQGLPDYQLTLRLNLAARRLLETSEPAATVAMALGFSSPSHFGARFRERFGMSPTVFRRRRDGR